MTEATEKKVKQPKAEAAQKTPVKAKASKADAAPAPKSPKAAAAAKAAQTEKKATEGKSLRVVQTGSVIGRKADQEATLIGLGLNKRLRARVLQDTPEIRGMIYKVRHLVRVEEA